MKAKINLSLLLAFVLVFLGVWSRMIPHLPNFTAVGAAALLAGSIFGMGWLAFLIPLASLFASDLYLGFYPGLEFVYAAMACNVLLGVFFFRRRAGLGLFALPALGSISFFVVSNLGVWWSAGLYPRTIAGLTECFAMAVPFYRSEAASEVLYFVALALAYRWIQAFEAKKSIQA